MGWGPLVMRGGSTTHTDHKPPSRIEQTPPILERRISLAVMTTLEEGFLASTGQLVDKEPSWVEGP